MVINQPAGIGDLLFLEPMFRHFWNLNGEKPKCIVREHLLWLQDYIESAIFVPAGQYSTIIDDDKQVPGYLPIRFANPIFRGHDKWYFEDYENCMLDKYRLVGLPVEKWKELNILFYPDRSLKLFAHLNISSESEYVVVNEYWSGGRIDIVPETNLKVIRMHNIPGFTLCDWAMIMKFAQENHHVSTGSFYLFEALGEMLGKIFIYPRPNGDGLRGIKNLNPSFKYTSMQ